MAKKSKTGGSKTTNTMKRRVPKSLSGVQRDAISSAEEKKLTSSSQKIKDGLVDPGGSYSPTRGLLDPDDFRKFEVTVRQNLTETQRIVRLLTEHLNKYHNPKGEENLWQIAFFSPNDPRCPDGGSPGINGHRVLTPAMLGAAWSGELQHKAGLTVFNGAICWNGKGTVERHMVCVITDELQQRHSLAKEEAATKTIRQIEESAAKTVGRKNVTMTETMRKRPLFHRPEAQDGKQETGDAVNSD